MNPQDLLTRLQTAIQGGYQVPDDVAGWLDAGIQEFEAGGGRKPFCLCLGLRGAGTVSLETYRARQRRDAALLAACELVPGESQSGDWHRCRAIAGVVAKFKRSWPRVPSSPDPAHLSMFGAVEVVFIVAAGAGLVVPSSAGGILARICKARQHKETGGGDCGDSKEPPLFRLFEKAMMFTRIHEIKKDTCTENFNPGNRGGHDIYRSDHGLKNGGTIADHRKP